MKIKRLFTQENFGKIGAFLSGGYALLLLLDFAVYFFGLSGGDMKIWTILSNAINILFYIFVANYFLKAKSNMFFGMYAIAIILFWDTVFPTIQLLLQGILTFNIFGAIVISLGSVFGILYFAFMLINNNKRSLRYNTVLIVLGSILLIIGVLNLGFTIGVGVEGIIALLAKETDMFSKMVQIIYAVIMMIESLFSIGFAVTYFMYPLVMKKVY